MTCYFLIQQVSFQHVVIFTTVCLICQLHEKELCEDIPGKAAAFS